MPREAAVLSVCLLLCACATSGVPQDSVTPRVLNANPDRYDDREVLVRGFVVLGTNGRSLYESRERLENFDRAFRAQTLGTDLTDFYLDCVTLLNAQLLEDNPSLFNEQMITIRGRFVSDYLDGDVLDLQACGGPTGLIVDEEDARRVFRDLQFEE